MQSNTEFKSLAFANKVDPAYFTGAFTKDMKDAINLTSTYNSSYSLSSVRK